MEEKSPEEWLRLVSQDPLLLENVPEELRTEELYITALRNPKRGSLAMQFVPEEMKTHDFCMRAVSCNPMSLAFVPVENRTYTICQFAILCDPHTLEFVPVSIQHGSIVAVAAGKLGKLHAAHIGTEGQLSSKFRESMLKIMRAVRADMWKLFITSYSRALNSAKVNNT